MEESLFNLTGNRVPLEVSKEGTGRTYTGATQMRWRVPLEDYRGEFHGYILTFCFPTRR